MSTILETLQIASLDAYSEPEAPWDVAADKQEDEIEAGTVQSVTIDAVMARLEARFLK